MKKRKKPKFFLTEDSFKNITNIAFNSKLNIVVRQSNYTYEITSVETKPDGTPIIEAKFFQNMMSENAMIASAVIEKEIKENKFIAPEINKHNLNYNRFASLDFLKTIGETIYCIDIKSAYLQVLYNKGIIQKSTYENTQRLEKTDRLAAVGMLAKSINIILYNDEGIEIDIFLDQKETRYFFFLCISEINERMQAIANILGRDNFIFFWVDGIYFKDPKCREQIETYLTNEGFKFTFEELIKFKVTEYKRRWWLSYWQIKPDRCIQKKFCIPKDNMKITKSVIETLELHHERNSIIKQNKIK